MLKDIRKGEEKQDRPEKVKPENQGKKRNPSQGEQGVRITSGDLKNSGLKKVQFLQRASKPGEASTGDNELSTMLARFNRNRNPSGNDDDKGSEGEPALTRTVRGVTVRRSKQRKSAETKSSTSGF